MIKVKIELWPFGNGKHKKRLATITISNNGQGSPDIGNYDYSIEIGGSKQQGQILGFERSIKNAVDLLYEVLKNALN